MIVWKRACIWWVLLYTLVLIPLAPSVVHYRELETSGVWTTGTITQKTYHGVVVYTFVVEKNEYSGKSRTGLAGIPRSELLRAGDSISVSYLPTDPQVNAAGTVEDLLQDQYESLFALALFTAIGVAIMFVWRHFFPRKSILPT